MTYKDTDAALTVLKREKTTIWLNEVHSTPLQQALRDLQSAFSNFFDKRSAYPTFKSRSGIQTARYTKAGFKLADGRRLKVGKLGVLRLRWDRNLPCYPSSITIIKEATGRYFVSFVVDVETETFESTGETVGIDFGIRRLASLSNGEHVPNPKHLNKRQKRLALLQRRLARKQKASKRRAKAKQAVARCHAKIADSRKDTLNKLTTRLVKEFDVIFIEDLNLRGMVKNHNLARSLSDAGIGMAVRMLEEKAERYGKQMVKVDRFFPSSKMCSACGHVNSAVMLGVEEWSCPGCGAHHDRDDNAALNIKAVGQTVLAHGAGVRAAAPSGEGANL